MERTARVGGGGSAAKRPAAASGLVGRFEIACRTPSAVAVEAGEQ